MTPSGSNTGFQLQRLTEGVGLKQHDVRFAEVAHQRVRGVVDDGDGLHVVALHHHEAVDNREGGLRSTSTRTDIRPARLPACLT
jgi:hypothetical protein